MNRITSYIASAVYYDTALRDSVIKNMENNVNALADSCGLDVNEVLLHAYNARRRSLTKYVVLFILTLITLLSGGTLLLITIPIGWIFLFIHRINMENHILRGMFSPNNPNPSSRLAPHNRNALLAQKNLQTCKNVIYYKGFSPFVGSGFKIPDSGWSFAIDIQRPANQGGQPLPFQVSEAYEKIARDVQSLNIPNLNIEDRLIVNGRAIRQNNKLLPNPLSFPVAELNPLEIKPFMSLANKNARYYQMIQIRDWDDELVFTTFLRISKSENKFIFVECNYSILTPVREEYKKIRSLTASLSFSDYIRELTTCLFLLPFEALYSVAFIYKKFIKQFDTLVHGGKSADERHLLRNVRSNADYDYGAVQSIREQVSSDMYPQYFHVLDKDMYLKIIEKKVLSSFEEFLESKGIDTAEFKERETKILNEGVIITGGQINAGSIDVGKKQNFFGTVKTALTTAGKSSGGSQNN